MEYNTELESTIYKKIQDFITTLPLDQPWRGVICMGVLNGFLTSAMSNQDNPHSIMEALDHMSVQMVEVYKSGNTDILFGSEDLLNLGNVDNVDIQEDNTNNQSSTSSTSATSSDSR